MTIGTSSPERGEAPASIRPERAIRILGVDDDPVSSLLLQATLRRRGYDITLANDGARAWEMIEALTLPPPAGNADGDDPASPQPCGAPLLAILDWYMPGPNGVELCQRIRRLPTDRLVYAILLTSHNGHEAIVTGLQAGAHDYIVKPFDPDELLARVQVGLRVLALQQALADRVRELEEALTQVKQLRGLLPICSYCKSIRRDGNYWQQVEHYIAANSDAQFSHGICPACYHTQIEPQLAALRQKSAAAHSPDGKPSSQPRCPGSSTTPKE